MGEAEVIELMQASVWAVIMMCTPLVLPAMAVGIVIAFGQALTQIQENTLTFVPKMLAVFVAVVFSASFVGSQLQILTQQLYEKIEVGFAQPF